MQEGGGGHKALNTYYNAWVSRECPKIISGVSNKIMYLNKHQLEKLAQLATLIALQLRWYTEKIMSIAIILLN